ncbi:MAG: type II toxin-antitoxin system death-on-curing family toxin [Planctomycetaceae bacterium]
MGASTIGFPSVDQVLAIHERVLREYGGAESVRDRGLLESAVAMPAAGFGGQFLHLGIPAMAAAYLFHLCRNHPFVDGNKRTALAAAIAFLYANHFQLKASLKEVESLTLGVADGSVTKEHATEFFRAHARSARSSQSRRGQSKRRRPKR